ncbi:hypothetical protein [Clostridium sartagoforme]|uniref:Uncharacterized protein n=1 Tax=Clostridium sartagoforme AAU1 TaxID=1202534 RepID=R9BS18_9CLOT|nr:hypothetical protein [Clostridium sartagoforme]EOR19807.1 hypothetical protein A500_20059 [Clostridium sartagoforme AAU1]
MNRRVWGGKYNVQSKNDYSAIVECTYCCPYCGEATGSILTIYSEGFDLLDKGGFYEPLNCGYCSKSADVFFSK